MKKAGILVSVAVVIAGIAAIVSVAMASKNAARANEWVQTRATVERVDGANVVYRYEAGGGTHRVTSAGRPKARYSEGATVLAYVNPTNAAQAVLDLPPRPASWPAVAGGIAMLAGIVMAIGFGTQGSPEVRKKKAMAAAAARRKGGQPMQRLQPPPPVNWNRGEDTTRTRGARPPGEKR